MTGDRLILEGNGNVRDKQATQRDAKKYLGMDLGIKMLSREHHR